MSLTSTPTQYIAHSLNFMELGHVISYDIKYRMGVELEGEE